MRDTNAVDEAAIIQSVLGRLLPSDPVSVAPVGDDLDLRLHLVGDDEPVGLRLPGPRSSELRPWIYTEPDGIADWASMLGIWLDEDLHAGSGHLADERRDGIRYLIAAPYGLQRADAAEHERLLALAPERWF